MRIAHLIHGLGLGGAQQVIKFIVAERSAGFEHWVISCHGGVFAPQIAEVGGQVRILPRRLPKFDPFWVLAMARVFRELGIHVVHGHLFGDSLHGYFACWQADLLPMVLTLHNSTDARTSLQLRGYRYLLSRRTLPIACSEFVRTSFLEHAGEAAGRIRTITNGIAERPALEPPEIWRQRLLAATGFPADAVVLATLGRMTEQKALDALLRAAAKLPADLPWRLALFGDGEQRPLLEELATTLGLRERVAFLGFRADAADFLPACDVVVFSSIFEGLPIAMLEAMAAAKPVVATRVGGIPGALDDGVEGLSIPARDDAALAAALEQVIRDEGLRLRLGAAGRARFTREFRAQAMTRSYEQVYAEAAAFSRLFVQGI